MKIFLDKIAPKSRKSKKSKFELSCFLISGSVCKLKTIIALEMARAFIIRKVPGPELIDPIRVRNIDPILRYEEACDNVEITVIGLIKVQFVGFSRFPGLQSHHGKGPVQSPLHPSPFPGVPSSHSLS